MSRLDDIMTLVDGDGLEAVTEAKLLIKQLMLELIGPEDINKDVEFILEEIRQKVRSL